VFYGPDGVRIYFDEVWIIEWINPDTGVAELGTLVGRAGDGWKPDDLSTWDYVNNYEVYETALIEGLRIYCQETLSPTTSPSKVPTGTPSGTPTKEPTTPPTDIPSSHPGNAPAYAPVLSCTNFIVSRSACDETTFLDALFIVDSSSSIGEEQYEAYKEWLAWSLPRSIPEDSNVALMQYATSQYLEFPFGKYHTREEWQAQMELMEHIGGLTWTKQAFNFAFGTIWPGTDPGRQRVMVLITDGVWSTGQNPCDLYGTMTAMGIDLIVVGNEEVEQHIDCLEYENVYFVDLSDYFDEDEANALLELDKVFCPESTPFDGGYSQTGFANGMPVYHHRDKYIAQYTGSTWFFSHEDIGIMMSFTETDSEHPEDRRNWNFTSFHPSLNNTYYADVRIFCSETVIPTYLPSVEPTIAPTFTDPTISPTHDPTTSPSKTPSRTPSVIPTMAPTEPTVGPTVLPSFAPSVGPSCSPTLFPTNPTRTPSKTPSRTPSYVPTMAPTEPTVAPTHQPTTCPTTSPTTAPSVAPTRNPTTIYEYIEYLEEKQGNLTELLLNCEDTVDFLTESLEKVTCTNDDPYMMEINSLIFPAQKLYNCSEILSEDDSSWLDVQGVHGYDSICDIPVIQTAEQYANEDEFETVMADIRNITNNTETLIREICRFECDYCGYGESSSEVVTDLVNEWQTCERELHFLQNHVDNLEETGSCVYDPLDCEDFNPEIMALKARVDELEADVDVMNATVNEEIEVECSLEELERIKDEIRDWEIAVIHGGLSCAFVPYLFCDAVSVCEWISGGICSQLKR